MEPNDISASTPVATPVATPLGHILREARERLGLSVADVAHQIKFAPRQIEALEADDFQRLPEMTFVRGFVRSYAKILQLEVAPLLAALPQANAAPEHIVPASVEVPFPNAHSPQRQNLIWLGAALLLSVVVVAFAVWHYTTPQSVSNEVAQVETPVLLPAQIQIVAASPVPEAAPMIASSVPTLPEKTTATAVQPPVETIKPLAPVTQSPPVAALPVKPPVAAVQPPVQAIKPLTPATQTPSAAALPVKPPVAAVQSPAQTIKPLAPVTQTPSAAALPVKPPVAAVQPPAQAIKPLAPVAKSPPVAALPVKPVVAAVQPPSQAIKPLAPLVQSPVPAAKATDKQSLAAKPLAETGTAPQATLRIVFDDDSWTEIKDKSGKTLSSQVNPRGSELRLSGSAPFSLVIGHAEKVQVYHRGKKVDLTDYINDTSEVARLTLE